MAPEVMCRHNHTQSVDFFAVGVMAFECMFGKVSNSLFIGACLALPSHSLAFILARPGLEIQTLICFGAQRPYVGRSRKEIRDHILSKQIQIQVKDIPPGWSKEAADFVNRVSCFASGLFELLRHQGKILF